MSEEYNYFKCPRCEKPTKHLEITYSEGLADEMGVEYMSVWEKIPVGLLFVGEEIFSIGKTGFFILGRKFWKCTECLRITQRNSSGEIC